MRDDQRDEPGSRREEVGAPATPPAPDSAQAVIEGHAHGTEDPGNSAANAPTPSDVLPPAGPHARPDLVNEIATPGTGALTPVGAHDDVDSTSS